MDEVSPRLLFHGSLMGTDEFIAGTLRFAYMFIMSGAGHTHTSRGELCLREVAGVYLCQWIAQLIDADQADPVTVRPTAEHIMLKP